MRRQNDQDLIRALTAIEPSSKAAQLRQLMPVILEKIAAGARIAEILAVLQAGGLEISQNTLKSYLYRYRKKLGATPGQTVRPSAASAPATNRADVVDTPTQEPVSMNELDQIMKPDPKKMAEDMDHYERIGKHKRSRKP